MVTNIFPLVEAATSSIMPTLLHNNKLWFRLDQWTRGNIPMWGQLLACYVLRY